MTLENAKELLRVLIALACEDGDFHPREKALIYSIGRANRVSEEVLDDLIKHPKGLSENLSALPYEDQFEILYNLLRMMKADSVVMNEEVFFTQKITAHLGFQLSAIMELYPHVHVNVRDPQKLKALRNQLMAHRLDNSTTKENHTSQ